MTDAMAIGTTTPSLEARFVDRLQRLDAPRVLELGTMRWEADRPTHHARWLPPGTEHVMGDVLAGPDVHAVCDAHHLPWPDQTFDAAIAVAIWEHLVRPWVAADELARVLRPGGAAIVVTHQTFPLHGYPHDYFRFSTEALASLFAPPAWESCDTAYAYPCAIVPGPEVTRWNPAAEAFLNVEALAVRASV